MAKMSIGAAFSETFAFLKANWTQMLIWVGGALVVVGLLGYLFLGSTFSAMALAPNDPSLVMGAFSKIFLFALIAAVILYGVSMLIWRGGMHPGEAPNFAWAFQAGPALAFGMFVVMIAAYIVIFIIMFILTLIFGRADIGRSWCHRRRRDFPDDHPLYRPDRLHAVGASPFHGCRSRDGKSADAQSGDGSR